MKSRRDAILEGATTAARIHRQFELRRQVEAQASNADAFGTIVKEKIPSCSARLTACVTPSRRGQFPELL